MIVNPTNKGWEIIYHRAHALLAAQIAFHWRPEEVIYLPETIAAISHHDDLEGEWEGNNLSQAGAPLDFTLNKKILVSPLKNLVEKARYRGRWVTLLTIMHLEYLQEPLRGQLQELDEFLDWIKDLRNRIKKELKVSKKDAEKAYAFMLWCDRLSLILCRREIPEATRKLEIGDGPDGIKYFLWEKSPGTLLVEPWPFARASVHLSIEASYPEGLKFNDNDDLIAELKNAPVSVLEWNLQRS